MNCFMCQSDVDFNTKFCGQCGAPQKRTPEPLMLPAAAPQNIIFDARIPPLPGTPVPHDCVWARYPYPGPLQGERHVSLYEKFFGYPTPGGAYQRILEMGLVVGRTAIEIITVAGNPSGATTMVDGDELYTWVGKDFWTNRPFSITLVFDRYGVCGGVADEHEPSNSTSSSSIGFLLPF